MWKSSSFAKVVHKIMASFLPFYWSLEREKGKASKDFLLVFYQQINTLAGSRTNLKFSITRVPRVLFEFLTHSAASACINMPVRTYTKHGPPVHEPPLWTRSMDHPCGPGPWTTPVDPVHGPPLKKFFEGQQARGNGRRWEDRLECFFFILVMLLC